MRLDVAIAGLGYFSRFHQDAWSRCADVRVVGVADRDPARRAEAAKLFPDASAFDDAEAMMDTVQPSLVDIVTPPATHLGLVRAAAMRGIAAICQKPLAPEWAEAVAVVETAERHGTLLAVHENFRWMPWFREARALVEAGRIGTPLHIAFRLRPGDGQGPEAYLSRQPYFQQMPRFLIHETGIHLVDVFRFVMGEITGVFARLKRFNPVITGEDAGLVVFDFANGATGLFDGNRLVDHPARDTRMTNGVMFVEGTGGTVRLDGFGRLFLKPHGGEEAEHVYAWEDRGYGGDCVFHQTRHIVDHLLTGSPLVNDGRAYLRNFAIEEAIYRSDREARFIEV
jgi:predicted dehydrogenase